MPSRTAQPKIGIDAASRSLATEGSLSALAGSVYDGPTYNLAGWLGNYQMGWLRSNGYSERECLVFLASCYLAGAVFTSLVKIQRTIPRQT